MVGQIPLPTICVQDSLNEVISDVIDGKASSEEFWIELGDQEVRFLATPETTLKSVSNPDYTAIVSKSALQLEVCRNNGILGLVRLGEHKLSLKKLGWQISAASVQGSRAILGSSMGGLKVVDFNDPGYQLELAGHPLFTSVARFFPSGEVALSAGMDYSIKLWDLASGTQIQSLSHQKGLIDQVSFVGRGRNLLSLCSRDQTVVLWEVSAPQVVSKYHIPGAQCLELWHRENAVASHDGNGHFGTDGKVAIVGTPESTVAIDLRAGAPTPIVDAGAEHLTISGSTMVRSSANYAYVHDLRMVDNPLFTFYTTIDATDHDQMIHQVLSTSSKLYMKTGYSSYAFDYTAHKVEVLANDNGLLTEFNNELYTVGKDITHFPL